MPVVESYEDVDVNVAAPEQHEDEADRPATPPPAKRRRGQVGLLFMLYHVVSVRFCSFYVDKV